MINVRQISNYPDLAQSDGSETLLLQQGGLGGPYASIGAASLVATALADPANGAMSVGVGAPADAVGEQLFSGNYVMALNGSVFFNSYIRQSPANTWTALSSGPVGAWSLEASGTLIWSLGAGLVDQSPAAQDVMLLSTAGDLQLPRGTLSVARDPSNAGEVATMGWVGNNTVASFNNRRGAVILSCQDVYTALGLASPVATEAWVMNAITQGITTLLSTCPLVNTFNGRSGSVWLMLSDITTVFYQPGQQPISPTPALTSNDDSIATTSWVNQFITQELEGAGGIIATQSWVLANTVNSFNGRLGPVTLTLADVTNVGAAPLNSPNFSGIPAAPTANPGTSTAQLATCAFVQAALASSVAGVASFNTRTGAVTLTNADITGAGGLANPNASLTGTPTAPTAAPGTSTTQIATTGFVAAAVNASVTSFNTRTGAVTLQLADITGVGGAPIASPTFTGAPAAPTAAPGTSTTQLATTGFVTAALTAAGGVSSFNSRTGAITLQANDISAAGGLVNPSVTLTGTPVAPTATAGTNTTQIATTQFVTQAVAGAVISFNTRTGAITLNAADITSAGGAALASPAFTGSPTAPTQSPGTNNTALATTAFVANAIATSTAGVTSFNTRTGAITLTSADITAAGGALLASPALSGTPTAPTATAGTNTTQLATTAYVQTALLSVTAGVASFNSRTGAVTLTNNDISAAGGALIASPTFTGTPAAPTPAPATNTTQLATCAFVRTGVTDGSNAAAGMVGEYISSTVLSGAAVPCTNNTPANVTSISLTAGDWDVAGNVVSSMSAGGTFAAGWISTTSAALPTAPNNGAQSQVAITNGAQAINAIVSTGTLRLLITATTTVYLGVQLGFASGTGAAYGFIGARRMR